MSNVAEVQTAVGRLPAADRIALFHWLALDEAVRAEQLSALRAAVDEGDRDLAAGRYTTLETDENFRVLAEDISNTSHR